MNQRDIHLKSPLIQRFWQAGILPDCPIYDMHGHMGESAKMLLPDSTPEKMLRHMDRSGVKKICFSHDYTLNCPQFSDADVVELIRPFGDRFGLYVSINPSYPEQYRNSLEHFFEWRPFTVGLKLLPSYHRMRVDSKLYDEALSFALQNNLPVLIHTWSDSFNSADIVRNMLDRHPGLRAMLAHCCRPEVEKAVALAKDFPNIYLELTSIPGYSGIIKYFCDEIGSERLLFGTDLPWFDAYQALGGVLFEDGLSENDIRNILYRNARKILNITEPVLP